MIDEIEKLPRILRIKDVRALLGGIARSQVDALEAAGDFPRRINITAKAVGWLEPEVVAWIKERAARRRPRR